MCDDDGNLNGYEAMLVTGSINEELYYLCKASEI